MFELILTENILFFSFIFFWVSVPWLLSLNKRMIWIKNICLLPGRLHVHSEVSLGIFELKLTSQFLLNIKMF